MSELGPTKMSQISNESLGHGCIALSIYRGLGLGLIHHPVFSFAASKKKAESKRKTQGKDRETSIDTETTNIQSKCRRRLMLPWQPVLSDTMRGE